MDANPKASIAPGLFQDLSTITSRIFRSVVAGAGGCEAHSSILHAANATASPEGRRVPPWSPISDEENAAVTPQRKHADTKRRSDGCKTPSANSCSRMPSPSRNDAPGAREDALDLNDDVMPLGDDAVLDLSDDRMEVE